MRHVFRVKKGIYKPAYVRKLRVEIRDLPFIDRIKVVQPRGLPLALYVEAYGTDDAHRVARVLIESEIDFDHGMIG